MNDGDGSSPVALARDEPIAQAEVGGRSAGTTLRQHRDGALDGVNLSQAVERSGVDEFAVSGERLTGDGGVVGLTGALC